MSSVGIFNITVATALLLSSLLLTISAQDACTSSSQPNPIAQQYANSVTGTLNATLAVVPIPLDTARQIIPSQYTILEGAYRALLPDFPAGMYPVLMQAGLDHDIQLAALGFTVPDFQRAGWSFPFLDLLGDGFTSFTWAPAQLISASNEIAIAGSREYGTMVSPSAFEPSCDAYGRRTESGGSSYYFSGNATDGSGKFARLEFSAATATAAASCGEGSTTTTAAAAGSPYPVAFYQNVTNQPIFGNGSSCDRQVRLFNSTINQGAFAPVPVRGTISSNLYPLEDVVGAGVGDIFGLLVDTPFIEFNGLECKSLQGYSGTGSGD